MSDYQVKYLITVNSEKAIEGINAFKTAIGSLNQSAASIENVRRQFVSIYDTMVGLTRKPINFTITANTREAVTQLETLQRQAISTISTLERLQQVAAQPVRMRTTGGNRGGRNNTAPIGGSVKGVKQVAQTPTDPRYITPSRRGGNVPTPHEQRTQFNGNRLGAFYSALDGRRLSSSDLKAAYSDHSRVGTASAAERSMQKFFRNIAGTNSIHGSTPTQETAWGMYRDHMRKIAASNPGKLWAQQANVPRLVPQSMELQNLNAQYAAMERMNAKQVVHERKQWRDLRRTRGPVTHPKYRTNTYGGVPAWRAAEYAASQRTAMYPPWTMPRSYSQMLPANQLVAPSGIPANYRPSRNYGGSSGNQTEGTGVRSNAVNRYGNLNYKLLGPTPLPNNGGMAIDMLKGMGIAYGIAGIGQAVSSIVDQATEYDNLMKTVENILRSHNTKTNFSARFSNMTRTVRNVGMETKYTVSEVADAAKFLAMAGLDVDAITQAIRPIADIALVGDTNLGETADLVTNIMTAYKIAPSKMRTAADILTNTFTMSNTTLTEIAEAYQYAAGPLMAGGVDFAEATGALGVLGDAGNKGSQAGTTMRTILQNIVNPTKKQKAAWDEIGINRYDNNGNRRSLVDIFKDLHNANLDVSVFYRLFHKTAASGAIALASSVDKWQSIILENFASGGLSKRLAEEKKNTLQGLWAQVKSVFIDRGVSVFEGSQGGIKDMMRSAIDYMGGYDTPGNTAKGDHFRDMLHEVSKTMMEFIHTIIDATKWFFKFYQFFEPMIKVWMRFSLAIWPVTKALSAFSTLWQGLLWLKTIPSRLINFANGIRAVTRATNENTAATVANRVSGGVSGGAVPPAPYSTRFVGWGLRQQKYMPAIYNPIANTWSDPGWQNTGQNGWRMGWNGFVGGLGTAWSGTKGFFRHPIQTLHNVPNTLRNVPNTLRNVPNSGIVKGIGRGLGYINSIPGASMLMGGVTAYKAMEQATDDEGSSTAAWMYGGAAVASMFGPWGMAVGAVLGIGGMIAENYHKVQLAKEAAQRIVALGQQYVVEDGMLVNKYADDATKYLDTIYAKNRNINEELRLRIQQTREALGLESMPTVDDSTGSTDTFTRIFEDAAGKYGTYAENTTAVTNLMNGLTESTGLGVTEKNGHLYLAWADQNGSGNHLVSDLQAMGNLSMAYEAATGSSTQQMRKEWNQAITTALLAGDPGGVQNVVDEFNRQVGNYDLSKINVNQGFTKEEWAKLAEDPQKFWSYDLNKMVRFNVLRSQLRIDDMPKLQKAYQDSYGKDSSDLWEKYVAIHPFLGQGGIPLDGEWLSKMGWNGTNFMSIDNGQITDIPQNLQELYETWGAFQIEMDKARQMGLFQSKDATVVENLNKMKEYQNYVAGLIVMANQEFAKTKGITAPNNWSIKEGAIIPQNQNWYQYNGGKGHIWSPSDTVATIQPTDLQVANPYPASNSKSSNYDPVNGLLASNLFNSTSNPLNLDTFQAAPATTQLNQQKTQPEVQVHIDDITDLLKDYRTAYDKNSSDLWSKYVALHPYLGEGGISLDGDWLARTGWNGSDFMVLDKDGHITNMSQNLQELYATWNIFEEEMMKARKMGLYNSKDATVTENLNKMQGYQNYVADLITVANFMKDQTNGVASQSNWGIKEGAINTQNQNWDLAFWDSNWGSTPWSSNWNIAPWDSNWNIAPWDSNWGLSNKLATYSSTASPFASSGYTNFVNTSSYALNPTALPASPFMAQANQQQTQPEVHVHIDSAVRIDKLEVRENTDDELIGQKVANELERIIVTSVNDSQRWARVGSCV